MRLRKLGRQLDYEMVQRMLFRDYSTPNFRRVISLYTPDIRSMWGYIVFAFLFVCSFVRMTFVRSFVRSFVFPSQGQSFCVKVYKTSYFEDPLMDFIHIWHDGRYRSKVFISTIPTPGVTLGSRSQTSNFHKKVRVKVFALKFIRPHILKTL